MNTINKLIPGNIYSFSELYRYPGTEREEFCVLYREPVTFIKEERRYSTAQRDMVLVKIFAHNKTNRVFTIPEEKFYIVQDKNIV